MPAGGREGEGNLCRGGAASVGAGERSYRAFCYTLKPPALPLTARSPPARPTPPEVQSRCERLGSYDPCHPGPGGLASGGPGTAQTLRVVAVADFVDDSLDGSLIGAERLSEDLQRLLADRARDRLRIVPVGEVRAAMRARGYRPHDLVSPTRAAEIARAVGADWIVMGRWSHLDRDIEPLPDGRRLAFGQALIEIRVREAGSRRILLEESFSGLAGGAGSFGSGGGNLLRQAAEVALRRAAERIAGL